MSATDIYYTTVLTMYRTFGVGEREYVSCTIQLPC